MWRLFEYIIYAIIKNMNKRNAAVLSTVVILKKTMAVFFEFFLNIYLFDIMNGNFGFLMAYSSYGAVVGLIAMYVALKFLNRKNAKFVFCFSLILRIVSILMLLTLQDNILSYIWIFKAIDRTSDMWYYAVYETSLIRTSKHGRVGSFVASMSILESITAVLAPAAFGLIIDSFSYEVLFAIIAVDAILTAIIGMNIKIDFKSERLHLVKFMHRAFAKPNMREAYKTMFYQRITMTGAMRYLLPIMMTMTLGTEFGVGSYTGLFAAVFILMMSGVRILNRYHVVKKFYIPSAFIILASAIVMIADANEATILVYCFVSQTIGNVIATESKGAVYAIGKEEGLVRYTRESILTWNIFLVCGQLIGNLIAYLAFVGFDSQVGIIVAMTALMPFIIIQAYHLQNVQKWLKGR